MKFIRLYLSKMLPKTAEFGNLLEATVLNISAEKSRTGDLSQMLLSFSFVYTDIQFPSAYREWARIASWSSSEGKQWILLSAGVRWRSATRHSYKMPALHVDRAAGQRAVTHCQEHPDVYLRREYVTFIEPPNVWSRIARTKTTQLRCLGCHSTYSVPPVTN